ncbi:hypothetical protein ECG_03024 [Echinococcus granulosus]|uniref:SH2 domain-containing protein n=1 Tax=Echinococcus granulosus TaxID=6210 RepID=A0A068WJQ2_ECHGR|nr:hypothetical protein ECG_03024 [Echinococcus granulosus]CDS20007.1 hypothetical protein EgrG_000219500 [Echinococcus granulosus]
MKLTDKKLEKEVARCANHDNTKHLLQVEKYDLKEDITLSSGAAGIAKIKNPLCDTDPIETVRIEVDLGLLLEQCIKSTEIARNCISTAETMESSTKELGTSGDLLHVDESLNEVILRADQLFKIYAGLIGTIQALKASETVLDNVPQEDGPKATSTNERCLPSPICNDHSPLFAPVVTEIHEEGFLQSLCGFAERKCIFCATYVFRSQCLASVRTIYITLPHSPQITFPTKLKSMVELDRLSAGDPSETEPSRRWWEGAKNPWILPNNVSRLVQSNRSMGTFRLRKRLANALSKLVTPRRRATSGSAGDCEELKLDIGFSLDALAGSEYIQFVEADLDSSMYWYANAGTTVECLQQKSKKSSSGCRGSKVKLSLRRHKVEKFKRHWKNDFPSRLNDNDSLLQNSNEPECKVNVGSSIPKMSNSPRKGKSLLTLWKARRNSYKRSPENSLIVGSPSVKPSDSPRWNQGINGQKKHAQLVESDVQAQSGSHGKFFQKKVTSTNSMPRAEGSFGREDVKRERKGCFICGYQRQLETSNNIHLLKADARKPSFLRNTANNAKYQIRMPERMKHVRRKYGTPDDASEKASVER